MARLIAALVRQPFDLSAGPLLRLHVLQAGPHDHLLLFVLHHIICDGWSVEILLREGAAAYETGGFESTQQLQYADYSQWQQEREQDLPNLRIGSLQWCTREHPLWDFQCR